MSFHHRVPSPVSIDSSWCSWDGNSLLIDGVLIELEFALARVTEPDAQGGDVGLVTQDDLMLEFPLVEPGTPIERVPQIIVDLVDSLMSCLISLFDTSLLHINFIFAFHYFIST